MEQNGGCQRLDLGEKEWEVSVQGCKVSVYKMNKP